MPNILHLDIESTGLNAFEHGIHRLGGFMEVDGETLSGFDHKVRPFTGAKIEKKALEVGNITWNEIRAYDNMDIVFSRWCTMMRVFCDERHETKFFICGFNSGGMEVPFMREWYKQNGSSLFSTHFHSGFIDTMSMATEYLLQKGIVLYDYSLSGVAKALGIEVDNSQLHTPAYDALISRNIYHFII